MSIGYSPEKDGTISQYLGKSFEGDIIPIFKGIDPYGLMWKLGHLLPFVSSIRLNNPDISDQFYYIVDDGLLEGAELDFHAGKPGIHKPEDILPTAPYWELANFEPYPEER